MIEVLERLIPLLEGAGEGVFWLALGVILEGYFVAITVSSVICFIAFMVSRTINAVIAKPKSVEWSLGGSVIPSSGVGRITAALLQHKSTNYFHDDDIARIEKALYDGLKEKK